MLRRVRILFGRYADRHLHLRAPGRMLPDPWGRIDQITLHQSRFIVEGQAAVDQAVLEHGGGRAVVRPVNGGEGPSYRLDLPFEPGPARLVLRRGEAVQEVDLGGFAPLRVGLGRAALLPGFVGAGLRALPAVIRWFQSHDPAARAQVKKLLGLGPSERILPLEPWRIGGTAAPEAAGPITLVMPVYNAFDLLTEALARVEAHTEAEWRLILIEDASSDPQVRPFLRAWAAARPGRVELLENDCNLGFIGSVNRGFAAALAAPDADRRPVILLNSDAMVPPGWAARLIAPLAADPTVASVTPMSNEAELLSVPVICAPTALGAGEGDAVDAVARGFGAVQGLVDAPTGVGFCMAMNPAFLRRKPGFDPVFGRGYGEEVDWCRAVMRDGGRHLYLPGLFVEHRGGASFGSVEKQRLLQTNGAIVTARYPDFDGQVQRFLREDPLATPRLILGLAWADARARRVGGRVPVFFAHSLGGGAESYLTRRIAEEIAGPGGAAVVLRFGGGLRWGIELHCAAGRMVCGTHDPAQMRQLLDLLSARRVVYSCAVGDPDPAEVPALLCDLAAGPAHRLEVLIHDYFPISPSYTLLDADRRYRGLPDPATRDAAHRIRRPDGQVLSLAEWQALWAPAMAAAGEVVTFCTASRDLVAGAYPAAADRIVVRPHAALHAIEPVEPPAPRARPVIGVLGNIGAHKGADLLVALSRRLAQSREADLVLIGDLDPAYRLAPPARVHGAYRLADIPGLIRRYGIGCWLVPSIWPETFSFATQEVLATGLPAFGFDLGAQGEALAAAAAARGQGGVLPLQDGRPDLGALMERIGAGCRPAGSNEAPDEAQ